MYKFLSTLAIVAAIVVLGYTDDSNVCKLEKTSLTATYIRDQNNCSVYHVCVLGHNMGKLVCGDSLVFSITHRVCVRKGGDFDDCDKKSSLGGIIDDKLCNDHPNGNNRHPTDCHSYIPCFNHTSTTVMQCPDQLEFSLKLQRCVHHEESDCPIHKRN
ncbi:uncharacterized protein LOC115213031 [Argonauta hians]